MDERGGRLAGGDQQAFAELYDACADRIHFYLVARLGSRADADDVLQQTFVRLARTRERLAKVKNPVAYAFATARNEAIRFAGRHAREGRRGDPPVEELFREAASDDVEERETAEWVAGELAKLSPGLREVVELKIYAGLTFREIAEVTGLPQGTVATRYRSALERMRGRMAEER
jgi:RNA polymerase sigma-70 factor (ECF subfamily)